MWLASFIGCCALRSATSPRFTSAFSCAHRTIARATAAWPDGCVDVTASDGRRVFRGSAHLFSCLGLALGSDHLSSPTSLLSQLLKTSGEQRTSSLPSSHQSICNTLWFDSFPFPLMLTCGDINRASSTARCNCNPRQLWVIGCCCCCCCVRCAITMCEGDGH